MMAAMTIEFFIPWKVQPKQSVRGTKGGGHYADPKIKENAASLAGYIQDHGLAPVKPLEGALEATYRIVYAYRKKHKKQEAAGIIVPKETAPDTEQLSKQLGDVLEFTQFFHNDAQIATSHVIKEHGPDPGVHVTIARME